MAASSAQHNAPVIVMTPAMAQAANSQPGDPTIVIDFADTMKMPDPIIDPITIMVASSKLSPRTNCKLSPDTLSFDWAGVMAAMGILLTLSSTARYVFVKSRGRYFKHSETSTKYCAFCNLRLIRA